MCNKSCSSCEYDELPTANTSFHKVKFGISEAIEMAMLLPRVKKVRILFGWSKDIF